MRGLGELGNKYRWDEPKSIQPALDEKPLPIRYQVEPSLGPKRTVKFGVIIIRLKSSRNLGFQVSFGLGPVG